MIRFLLILFLYSYETFALRPSMPHGESVKRGYKAVHYLEKIRPSDINSSLNDFYHEEGISLPIPLMDRAHQLIGNMGQYQTYSRPAYYHGGLDIMGAPGQEVRSPVAGRIEAGYYSYEDTITGNSTKFWLPIKEAIQDPTKIPWGKKYFEIAVIDQFGNRFEFHHIDPDNLPEPILQKVLQEGSTVSKGSVIGFVIDIGSQRQGINMSHIHFNVVNRQGHFYNPLKLLHSINDQTPPEIKDVFVTKKGICYGAPVLTPIEESNGETEGEIIIRSQDWLHSEGFPMAPVRVSAHFDGQTFEWDFRESIVNKDGLRPDIRNVYLSKRCLPSIGTSLGASFSFDFYFRIPLPLNYSGAVTLKVYDQKSQYDERTIFINKVHSRSYR